MAEFTPHHLRRVRLDFLEAGEVPWRVGSRRPPEQLTLLPPLPVAPAPWEREPPDRVAPPPRFRFGVKRGDVWQAGRHRLLCGDASDPDSVARLFARNEAADLLFFDPPYGVRYSRRDRGSPCGTSLQPCIQGDDLSAHASRCLVAGSLRLAPLKAGGAFYLCSSAGIRETAFRLALEDAGLTLRQSLVWVKQGFVLSRQDYHWRHESILYGWKEGAAHAFYGGRTQDTVWQVDRPLRSDRHPTMKPVPLVARALKNSSLPGAVVYDAFAGSGTTLLACEATGRTSRVMEIEPRHCETILCRWNELTGEQPVRL